LERIKQQEEELQQSGGVVGRWRRQECPQAAFDFSLGDVDKPATTINLTDVANRDWGLKDASFVPLKVRPDQRGINHCLEDKLKSSSALVIWTTAFTRYLEDQGD
jgi:hypothetical protein